MNESFPGPFWLTSDALPNLCVQISRPGGLGQFRLVQPLLHAVQGPPQRVRHLVRVLRPVDGLRREASLRQGDVFRKRPVTPVTGQRGRPCSFPPSAAGRERYTGCMSDVTRLLDAAAADARPGALAGRVARKNCTALWASGIAPFSRSACKGRKWRPSVASCNARNAPCSASWDAFATNLSLQCEEQ